MRTAPDEGRRAEEKSDGWGASGLDARDDARNTQVYGNRYQHLDGERELIANAGHSPEIYEPDPEPTEQASAVVAAFHRPSIRERDEAYPCLVCVDDARVIECRDRLQWKWQRRRESGRWADLGYFRNRDVLIERSGLDLPELHALPPIHLGGE